LQLSFSVTVVSLLLPAALDRPSRYEMGTQNSLTSLTGVHNHSLPSTPFLLYLFFKSLRLEYCRCDCFSACSSIGIPEASVGLPLIACWQKVDSRKKPPQTLRASLRGEGSAERRTLDTERQILTDTSQGSMKSLKYRANRLRWSRTLPITANHCQPLPITANHCQSLPITANHCQSLPITANNCQQLPTTANNCQQLPTTANNCQPLPITVNQSES
jgi:hypothetical protein